MDIIKTRFEEHIALAQLVAQSEIMQQVADAAAIIKKALAGGHKVLFCGNGGTALIMLLAEMGVLLSVSRHSNTEKM